MEKDQALESNFLLKHASDAAAMDKEYLQSERSEYRKIIEELKETISGKDRDKQVLENENQKLKDRLNSLEDALKALESTKIKVFKWRGNP